MIKGSLSPPHPHAVKKGHVAVKVPSQADDHYMYAISPKSNNGGSNSNSAAHKRNVMNNASVVVDRRMHFLLNNGSLSCPSKIHILKPSNIDRLSTEAAKLYLSDSVTIDTRRNTIYLPRVCDIYRLDFGEDNISVLQNCMKMADDNLQREINGALQNVKHNYSSLTIKYHKYLCESRKSLELVPE